jgi:hypothetical protein
VVVCASSPNVGPLVGFAHALTVTPGARDDLDLRPGADHAVAGGAGDHCHRRAVLVRVDVVTRSSVNCRSRNQPGLGVRVHVHAGVDEAKRSRTSCGSRRVGEEGRVGRQRLRRDGRRRGERRGGRNDTCAEDRGERSHELCERAPTHQRTTALWVWLSVTGQSGAAGVTARKTNRRPTVNGELA